jgi:hypothetical protein
MDTRSNQSSDCENDNTSNRSSDYENDNTSNRSSDYENDNNTKVIINFIGQKKFSNIDNCIILGSK